MMLKKYKLLLVPYLRISVPVILLHAALCQYMYNKQVLPETTDDLLSIWIPAVLPWIPVLIWLRPRIALLKMKRGGRSSPDIAVMLVAAFAMMIPMMESASYFEKYCGKMTRLTTINDIGKMPATKYYTIDNSYIDKRHRGLYYSSYISGKNNSTLNFEIHFACPLYSDENGQYLNDKEQAKINPPSSDTITGNGSVTDSIVFTPPLVVEGTEIITDTTTIMPAPPAWFGVRYQTSMGNHTSVSKKKDKEHQFYYECLRQFDDSDLTHFTYLELVPDGSHRRHYWKAVVNSLSSLGEHETVILEGDYGDFNNRTGNRLLWIFLSYGIATLVFAIIIFLVKFDEDRLTRFEEKNGVDNFGVS